MGLLLPHGRRGRRHGAAPPLTEPTIRGHLIIAGILLALFLLDATLNHGVASLFLARKVIDLALYLAFWRH